MKMMEFKKATSKLLDSTSASSSSSDSLDSSMDSNGDALDDKDRDMVREPGQLSLILKDDPYNSMILLQYLKHYS